MPEATPLSLREKAVILMLDDVTGRFQFNTDLVLAGTVLAELAWKGRITFDGRKIVQHDSTPTGDGLLDVTLAALADPHSPADAGQFLIGALA